MMMIRTYLICFNGYIYSDNYIDDDQLWLDSKLTCGLCFKAEIDFDKYYIMKIMQVLYMRIGLGESLRNEKLIVYELWMSNV